MRSRPRRWARRRNSSAQRNGAPRTLPARKFREMALFVVDGRMGASSGRKVTALLSIGWPWKSAWEQFATDARHNSPRCGGPTHPRPARTKQHPRPLP